jgi:hypothetical protein
MIRLDPLGALTAAGAGFVGGVESIGKGLLGGVTRIVGGGDSPTKDGDEAAQRQAQYEALHRLRCRAMLDAALKSSEKGPAERRKRIEKEIAAVTAARK